MAPILFLLLLIASLANALPTYTQNGITLQINDQSNGQVPAATIQNQVNLFFQLYPSAAAGYQNAPTTVIVRLDPTLDQGSIALGSDGFGLSVASLQSNPNDSNYMNWAISYMLQYFYSTKAPTTQAPTTTTKVILTTSRPGTYTQNGITFIIDDKSNGQVSASIIQNLVNYFFQLYPQDMAAYNNAPTTVTAHLDPTIASDTIAVASDGFGLGVSDLNSSWFDLSYTNNTINAFLSSFYTTKTPGATTTAQIITTTKPSVATTKAPATTQSPTLATSAPNTWTQNGFTLIINDKSGGQIPSSAIQKQVQTFFAIYPGLAAQYTNPPTTVTLNLDPTLNYLAAGYGSNSLTLSSDHIIQEPADGGYMQFGLNSMLSFASTPKGPLTTPPNPSAGYSSLVDENRQAALDAHNKFRSTVALGNAINKDGTKLPTASNMYKMTWSKQVEADAQAWANQCNWQHYMPTGSNEGQNMWRSGGYVKDSSTALIEATKAFYDELALYGIDKTKLSIQDGIGHFTQLAWHFSNELGCGVANCSKMANVPETNYETFVVCNYRAQGNIGYDPIYTPGSPASNCTSYPNSVADPSSGMCVVQGLATIH